VKINSTLVSKAQSGGAFASYVEMLMGNSQAAKDGMMQSGFWYKDVSPFLGDAGKCTS
jgi:hypothetical protein